MYVGSIFFHIILISQTDNTPRINYFHPPDVIIHSKYLAEPPCLPQKNIVNAVPCSRRQPLPYLFYI